MSKIHCSTCGMPMNYQVTTVERENYEQRIKTLEEAGNKIISLYSQYVDEVVMQQEDTTTYTNLAIAFGEWQQALGGDE